MEWPVIYLENFTERGKAGYGAASHLGGGLGHALPDLVGRAFYASLKVYVTVSSLSADRCMHGFSVHVPALFLCLVPWR